jgi:SAM-dependent methyltransferase
MSGFEIDWAEHADHLATVAHDDAGWYAGLASGLVRPTDRLAVDVGCGGGGMAIALAAALPPGGRVVALDGAEAVLAGARAAAAAAGVAVEFRLADLAEPAGLLGLIGAPADLVWASASVHHAPDQQAAVSGLAALLAPGGRLALVEGGLRPRCLPWDLGVGTPGLELRLDAAEGRWFSGMRAALPGVVPMPYGWVAALSRAGLADPTTRSTLLEWPTPLPPADTAKVVDALRWRVDRLRRNGMLDPADEQTWGRLLDPDDPAFLGHRPDLYHLEARSVHIGHAVGSAG